MQSSSWIAAAFAALVLAACGDGTGVDPVTSGAYVLSSVDGRTGEPVVLWEYTHPNGHRRLMTADYDSLTFTSDSTVQRSWHRRYEEWYPDGSRAWEPLQASESHPALFRRTGDRIVLRTMPGFAPVQPDTFFIRGSTLVRGEWTGAYCEGCPEPVLSEFVYARD